MTKTQAFNLGRDCGLNGATTENCHFSIFATEELKEAWEKGKAAGDSKRATHSESEEGDEKLVN